MIAFLSGSLSARRAWIEMMQFVPITTSDVSLSARRAWIEITTLTFPGFCVEMSLSARRAWIEITSLTFFRASFASLSARRAWIEIVTVSLYPSSASVALRKESVDRNA